MPDPTRILPCKCVSDSPNGGQDAIYGVGKRLHNLCGKSGRDGGKSSALPRYRCTCCLNEKDVR